MAVTRLDWDIIESGSSPRLVTFPWITGKVRGGDHAVVLDYIARRWHNEVEKIIKAHSWGYAQRDVRGASGIPSEHSAGTAMDINAPAHPLRVPISKTFTPKQIATIRQIMKDVQGAARWGGEWSRPDGMHVELKGGNTLIGRVADLIRAGKLPGLGGDAVVKPVISVKPKPADDEYTAWVKDLQRNLNLWKSDLPDLAVDGVPGKATVARIKDWQRRNRGGAYKGIYIDGDPGPLTTGGLGIKARP